MSYSVKNYMEHGGETTVIGGTLRFENGAQIKGFPGAVNQAASTATSLAALKDDFNALLLKLKDAGVVAGDPWNVTVKAAPNLPIADTAANSGHATVTIDENVITITLDEAVSKLKDSDHGETWGTHKWIGFGVSTGLNSVVGVVFDDGIVKTTLGEGDASEATSVGLSAGEFVLYIKAEKILAQGGSFTLSGLGHAPTEYTMRIVEPEE